MSGALHFVLSRSFPRRLDYRDGSVTIDFVREEGLWTLRANRGRANAATCVLACSPGSRSHFEIVLHHHGFPVDPRGAAARILTRLEREGHAWHFFDR